MPPIVAPPNNPDPTPTPVEHPPLGESADARSGADRESQRRDAARPSPGPDAPGTTIDPAAADRAQRDGISYELALERNLIDRTRPHHPQPEVDRWYWAVIDAGLQDVDKWMYRICRESKGDPTSWNRSDPSGGSVGLLQINLGNRAFLGNVGVLSSPKLSRQEAAAELMDPKTNLRAALAIIDSGGERGWITRHRTPECAPPPGLIW